MKNTSQALIDALALEPHVEGGYFRRTYTSNNQTDKNQASLSCIYYLLTASNAIGHWHLNKSDIVHYFHTGNPLEYWLIDDTSSLKKIILGNDISQGHRPQLLVPGGTWKASRLLGNDHALISEAVTPAFDFTDMTLATEEMMKTSFPQHWPAIKAFVKQANE